MLCVHCERSSYDYMLCKGAWEKHTECDSSFRSSNPVTEKKNKANKSSTVTFSDLFETEIFETQQHRHY